MTFQQTESEPAGRKREGDFVYSLHFSNQIAAFDLEGSRSALAARVMDCVGRAFYAAGMSAMTQQVVLWNLSVKRSMGREEIVDRPMEFIEEVKEVCGEAGLVVFERMLGREIRREFLPSGALDEETKAKDLTEVLRSLASRLASPEQVVRRGSR